MVTEKFIEDIEIKIKPKINSSKICFIVYSSREPHIEWVIDCVDEIIGKREKYTVVRLNSSLKSEDSQYKELQDKIGSCCFAVVILDGFRPNVLFEYGILKGLNKPCIVLKEDHGTIDLLNYYSEDKKPPIVNPIMNIREHFSDIQDRYYVEYPKYNPKRIREIISEQFKRKEPEINTEFNRMIFPEKEQITSVVKEYSDILLSFLRKESTDFNSEVLELFLNTIKNIENLMTKYEFEPFELYYYVIAEIFDKIGRLQDVINIYDKLLLKNPKDIYGRQEKSIALQKMNKMDLALKVLDEGIEINPKSESLWHDKGNLLDDMGRKDEATLCFKKGIELDNSCPGIHYDYGTLLLSISNYKDALEQFIFALQIEPNDYHYLMRKGYTLYKLGNKEEGKGILDNLLKKHMNIAEIWYIRGRIDDDYEQALFFINKSLELDTNHIQVLCYKGQILSILGKEDEALEILKKVQDECKCPFLYVQISTILKNQSKYTEAKDFIDKGLQLNPNDISLKILHGEIFIRCGKLKEGKKLLKTILIKSITDATDLYNLACMYALLSDVKLSIKLLKASIKLDSKNNTIWQTDNDFNTIRDDELFKKVFRIDSKR
jgi:tetratricopeptide (TPR) repeat protein